MLTISSCDQLRVFIPRALEASYFPGLQSWD